MAARIRLRGWVGVVAAAAASAAVVVAQGAIAATAQGAVKATPPGPHFDVISVRVHQRAEQGNEAAAQVVNDTPDGVAYSGVTVLECIEKAYLVDDYQVQGAPAWAASDRYDIEAKAAAPISGAERGLMLQALLAERFHLAAQRTEREMGVLNLVIDRGGPKFYPANPDESPKLDQNAAVLVAVAQPMDALVGMLSQALHRPVIDKTGNRNVYDYQLDLQKYLGGAPGAPMGNDDLQSGVFLAVQQQLGLRLQAGRARVPTLVVSQIERPSLNP